MWQFKSRPFFSAVPGPINRGTYCFKLITCDGQACDYALKNTWLSSKRDEVSTLRRISDLEGVIKLIAHRRVCSLQSTTQNLRFGPSYRLLDASGASRHDTDLFLDLLILSPRGESLSVPGIRLLDKSMVLNVVRALFLRGYSIEILVQEIY